MARIKNLLFSLVALVMLSFTAVGQSHGGEWLKIDVIVCEFAPPKYIKWNTLVVEISVCCSICGSFQHGRFGGRLEAGSSAGRIWRLCNLPVSRNGVRLPYRSL